MKKYFLSMLGAGLLLTSCQNDDLVMPGTGEEVQATFTISVPDAMGTRAGEVNSAQGGFSNGAGALNYTVALLRAEDDVVMWSSNTPDAVDGKSATFSPTVVLGYNYEIVAYATFDAAIAAPAVGSVIPADSGLGAISTLKGINDETEDAYFCNTTILGEANMTATLKRPFGKLRLVAEDYNQIYALGLEVAKVKVTYGDAVLMENQFDASSKAFEITATSKVFEFEGETAYNAEANKNNDGVYTVFADYLPASETGETMYPFTIEVTYANNKGTYTRNFTQDIPVKRNYLTTLRGNFFTAEAALTLTVDEMFEGEINLDTKYTYFKVTKEDELKAALTSNHEHIYVELDADLAVDVTAWETLAFGGDKTKSITINGEQVVTRGATPTLTFNQLNSDWNNIATKNGAKLILKNLKVTNSGCNNGPWNRHDLNFACDVEMENVYSDKAVALKAGGYLKNVTIEDKNTSDTYALWIQPNGQTVILEDCNIFMLDCTDGRGIKIDEEYVSDVKAPTLNVSGTTFKTEEKSAVLVKSVAGATINWGEGNDISGVVADSKYAVWVDEASTAYANKVIVNGTNKRVEGQVDVNEVSSLENAIKNGDKYIVLAENVNFGTIEVGDMKDVTIEGGENSVMIFKTDANTKIENVTLKNINFKYTGATADCGVVIDANAQIDNLVLDGCIFTGTGAKAGRGLSGLNNNASIVIKNTTFKDLGYPIYAWGGYESLVIEGCTFDNIKSWAIMPQSGFDGDLTVTGNTFKNCLGGGLIKAGTLTAGHTFTFTNNTITGCTIAGDHNWFQFNVSAGTSVISGNTKDGIDWTPTAADGLK